MSDEFFPIPADLRWQPSTPPPPRSGGVDEKQQLREEWARFGSALAELSREQQLLEQDRRKLRQTELVLELRAEQCDEKEKRLTEWQAALERESVRLATLQESLHAGDVPAAGVPGAGVAPDTVPVAIELGSSGVEVLNRSLAGTVVLLTVIGALILIFARLFQVV